MTVVVGFDTEHARDERMAAEMLHALLQHYPGHAWFITIKGGIVQIKDMDISDKWGMAIHYTQVDSDASVRQRKVIRSAGEWLERANHRRGAKQDRITELEGIPDKDLARARLS